MVGERLEDDAGLLLDDRRADAEEDPAVDGVPDEASEQGDGAGLEDDGREDRPLAGAEGAQDRELPAALVHGVVDAREQPEPGDGDHEIGHVEQHLGDPADLQEEGAEH